MRKTSTKLLHLFTRVDDGFKCKGLLSTAPTSTTNGSQMAIRVLDVMKPNYMIPGNVLRAETGEFLLLLECPQPGDLYHSFHAVVANKLYTWTRKEQIIDPVTKMPRDTVDKNMGPLYAYFDHPTDQAFEKLNTTTYQFYTGQDVRVGDKVDGKQVSKVVQTFGVKLVSAN